MCVCVCACVCVRVVFVSVCVRVACLCLCVCMCEYVCVAQFIKNKFLCRHDFIFVAVYMCFAHTISGDI